MSSTWSEPCVHLSAIVCHAKELYDNCNDCVDKRPPYWDPSFRSRSLDCYVGCYVCGLHALPLRNVVCGKRCFNSCISLESMPVIGHDHNEDQWFAFIHSVLGYSHVHSNEVLWAMWLLDNVTKHLLWEDHPISWAAWIPHVLPNYDKLHVLQYVVVNSRVPGQTIHVLQCIYIYIYIYIEREMYICIYIYIYI